MVIEENIESLKEIMLTLGQLLPQNLDAKYQTKCFLEFEVDDVDTDVIAGFAIVSKEEMYYFPLKLGDISEIILVNEIEIPLHSVLEWRKYYELMEKIEMIDKKV